MLQSILAPSSVLVTSSDAPVTSSNARAASSVLAASSHFSLLQNMRRLDGCLALPSGFQIGDGSW